MSRVFEVQGIARNFDDPDSRCIMEVRHRRLPFWGVQYHPESQYSKCCHAVVYPFLQACLDQRQTREKSVEKGLNGHCHPNLRHVRPSKAHNGDSAVDSTVVAWESFPLDIRLSNLLGGNLIDTEQFVLLDSGTKDDWTILSSCSTSLVFPILTRTRRVDFQASRQHKITA